MAKKRKLIREIPAYLLRNIQLIGVFVVIILAPETLESRSRTPKCRIIA